MACSAAGFATKSAGARYLKASQPMRRMNLNIRLADQNPACCGRSHERSTQFSVTTVEPLNYQLTTVSTGLANTGTCRFCNPIWAKATGTKPPKKHNINPANAEISGARKRVRWRPAGPERT